MKKLFSLFLSCLLQVAHLAAMPQDAVRSIEFPFAAELPSNEITDIFQDSNGFVWLGTSNGLSRYDGYAVQNFRADFRNPNLLTSNHITCFEEDGQYVWIGTSHGLNVFDKQTMRLHPYKHRDLDRLYIVSLRRTADGMLWIAGQGQLFCLDSENRRCTRYALTAPDGQPIRYNTLSCDRQRQLWLCSQSGLIRYDEQHKRFTLYPQIGEYNNPFSLFQDREGRYWIATWGEGLWEMTPGTCAARTSFRRQPLINGRGDISDERCFSMAQDDTYGYLWVLSYNSLYTLRTSPHGGNLLEQVDFSDRIDVNKMYTRIIKCHDGSLWLSSYDHGTIISFPQEKVSNYPLTALSRDLKWKPNLLTLCRDNSGNFWFNQDRFGICLQHTGSGQLTYAAPEERTITIDSRVTAPHISSNGIWFAHTARPVVYHLQEKDGRIASRLALDLGQIRGTQQNITQMEEDSQAHLWLLAQGGITAWEERTGRLWSTPDTVRFLRFALGQHNVWAVSDNGILHTLQPTDSCHLYIRRINRLPLSPHESVRMMCTDCSLRLWFSTSQGRILQYDSKQDEYSDQTESLNKEGGDILNLLADRQHLWVITHHKAIFHDLCKKTTKEYAVPDDNFAVKIFRNQASYLDADGTLFAGGNGGFISVNPDNTIDNNSNNNGHIMLSDVKVDGQSIFFATTGEEQETSTDIANIQLTHKARNISIEFTDLHCITGRKPLYAFMLEGEDEQWVTLDNAERHAAFYNRIGKGTHRLYVKSVKENGLFGEAQLITCIEVMPAWWDTTWAYIIYTLLAAAIAGLALRLYVLRLQAAGHRKLQELLTQTRLDYITNVSHELLTPLSIIACISDYWEKQYPNEKKQSGIMRNHIYRLRHLLQQVLDFRKAESGKLALKVKRGNITDFIQRNSLINFLPIAEQKHIALTSDVPEQEIWGYLDFDKVDKILYNLMSNAIKYTPENRTIRFSAAISATDNSAARILTLRVEDEGIGISGKDIKRIFTRFYTGSNGQSGVSNGIGLSLTKELAELHHGHIKAESEQGRGSVFTVTLPIDRTAYSDEEIEKEVKEEPIAHSANISAPEDSETTDTERTTVLLVDDNRDLLDTMSMLLEHTYNIVTADNGKEALALLEHTSPDLIVSDVMMPVMDGYALCRHIKSHMESSHIPVILLTAKQTAADKIDAYNAGANGYLAKPFETDVLRAKIDNLLRLFRQRQQTFRAEDRICLRELEYQSEDTLFLQNIADYIHTHLDDEDCGVEQLAEHVHVSKSTLHRKVKAMTGLTPSDFVRNIKLKYACTLLAQHGCSVSDAAYAIGFSTPKYFTKCFKKEFGLTPTEYQQKKSTEPQA